MKLSIVIPTYNRKSHIMDALCRIQTQLMLARPVEVIVVLDPSGDASEILTECFQNIRWIVNQSRIGFIESVIKGIQTATGEYCWIVGDDDILCEDAIPTLVQRLALTKPGMLVSVESEKDSANMPFGIYESIQDYIAACLGSRPSVLVEELNLASRVFRRELFLEDTARIHASTLFGHIYSVSQQLTKARLPVDLFDGNIFSMLPQSQRPMWHDFPADIDRTLSDYFTWLGRYTGMEVDPIMVLAENRAEFRKSIGNPVQFIKDHHKAIFNFKAWRYALSRVLWK